MGGRVLECGRVLEGWRVPEGSRAGCASKMPDAEKPGTHRVTTMPGLSERSVSARWQTAKRAGQV